MTLLFELRQKLSQGFLAAWMRWPRKQARKDAEKAWGQKVTSPEIDEKIQIALDWQVPMLEQREPQYIPLFATWLRGERWEDEPPTKPKTINRPIAAVIPMVQQQMDATARIKALIAAGVDPEQAKQDVYRALGWVKDPH